MLDEDVIVAQKAGLNKAVERLTTQTEVADKIVTLNVTTVMKVEMGKEDKVVEWVEAVHTER